VVSFSYWSIKPWFQSEGKLTDALIIPSSWGFPTCHVRHQDFFWHRCQRLKKKKLPRQPRAIKNFSGAVAGEKEDFCKGSLSLPISLLCYCFAWFLYFILCASFYQKYKK
jgi:hypothetical protein